MGQAIDELCHGLNGIKREVPRGVMTVTYDLAVVVGATREIRDLQAQHENQKTNIRYLADRGDEAAKHIEALEGELARKAFEIQILQMTQGALKMEIDRLRAEASVVAPTINATGALLTFKVDGSVELSADSVQVTGDLAVPA